MELNGKLILRNPFSCFILELFQAPLNDFVLTFVKLCITSTQSKTLLCGLYNNGLIRVFLTLYKLVCNNYFLLHFFIFSYSSFISPF